MVLRRPTDHPVDAVARNACELAVAAFLCSSFLHNLQTLNVEASFAERFDPINGYYDDPWLLAPYTVAMYHAQVLP
jgi:hypothetical protein